MHTHRSTVLSLAILLAAGAINPLLAQSNINVPAGTSVTLNETANYQNVTVGSGGSLETIDANSGGGGDHAITITLAAGGAGTIQNDGVIELAGNDQGNTTVFANPVTLSGSGTLTLVNTAGFNDASVKGPGTVTQAAGHTLIGGGGDHRRPLARASAHRWSTTAWSRPAASASSSTGPASSTTARSPLPAVPHSPLPRPRSTTPMAPSRWATSTAWCSSNNGIVVTGGTLQSIVPAPGGGSRIRVRSVHHHFQD